MHHSRCNSPHTDLMLGQLFRPHLRVCGQKGGGRRRAGDSGVGGIGVGVSLCLCLLLHSWVSVCVCVSWVSVCGCQFMFVVWVGVVGVSLSLWCGCQFVFVFAVAFVCVCVCDVRDECRRPLSVPSMRTLCATHTVVSCTDLSIS